MARKGLLAMSGLDGEEDLSPAPKKDVIAPAIRRGPVGAMSNDLTAHSVREIDCERIVVDGINDRLTSEDEDIAGLRESIREHGQQVPIMVRPITERPGFFRMVYGRRRLAAIKPLGLKIRALIRTLSDVDAILAQGQENNMRRDPSFIEKALFAKALQDQGIEPHVIYAALNIDRQTRSRMKSITDRLPSEIVDAIGAAPDVGRRRWLDLCDLITDSKGAVLGGLDAIRLSANAPSNERFDIFMNGAKSVTTNVARGQHSSSSRGGRQIFSDTGSLLGAVQRKRSAIEIKIGLAGNTEFGQWVEENGVDILRRLHAEWAEEATGSEQ